MSIAVVYDYTAWQEPVEDLSEDALAQMHVMAQRQVRAEALVASLEAQLKEARAALLDIKERELPGLMDQLGLDEWKSRSGVTVTMKEELRGSIPKAQEAEAFEWLEDNHQANLIKRQFTIEFGKDDDKWANKFEGDLKKRKKPLNVKRKKAVHPQTLLAFLRSALAEGTAIPLTTFGVYRQRFTKVQVEPDK